MGEAITEAKILLFLMPNVTWFLANVFYTSSHTGAACRLRWSEKRSPSFLSVLKPFTFHGLHNLQPARRFLGRLRLWCMIFSSSFIFITFLFLIHHNAHPIFGRAQIFGDKILLRWFSHYLSPLSFTSINSRHCLFLSWLTLRRAHLFLGRDKRAYERAG